MNEYTKDVPLIYDLCFTVNASVESHLRRNKFKAVVICHVYFEKSFIRSSRTLL